LSAHSFRASVNAHEFKSRTQINEPIITVDLPWLIAPILLWMLSTAFLFATIFTTNTNGQPLWKSTPLVALYCLDDDADLPSAKELTKELKRSDQEVVLKRSGIGWKLAKT
jgi:hypothetical protein